MQKFFFHMSDGAAPPDPEGVDYADLQAAKIAGARYLAQALGDSPEQFWRTGEWHLVVTDEAGLTLFHIQAVATDAPAVQVAIIPNPAV